MAKDDLVVRTHTNLSGVVRRAVFSPCERYRYELSIVWDESLPRMSWLMMNPSTATELENDSTVELCERRALKAGIYGGVEILNIFAYRETDSTKLAPLHNEGFDLVGPGNDEAIMRVAAGAAMVVCAWGKPGSLGGRGDRVRSMLEEAGVALHTLVLNKDGSPSHPLYIAYDKQPQPWLREGSRDARPKL